MYSGIFTQKDILQLDLARITVWFGCSSLYDLCHFASPDELNKWRRVHAKQGPDRSCNIVWKWFRGWLIVSDTLETFGLPHNENSHSKWHRGAEELQGCKVALSASESDFSLCQWGLTEWKISSNSSKFSCLSHWFVSSSNVCNNMTTVSAERCTDFLIADHTDWLFLCRSG